MTKNLKFSGHTEKARMWKCEKTAFIDLKSNDDAEDKDVGEKVSKERCEDWRSSAERDEHRNKAK